MLLVAPKNGMKGRKMIDFKRLQSSSGPPPSHPKEVFAALSGRSSEFKYLRDVQWQVLDTWYDRRNDRDVVIKMNTGTGKTAVGLLALRSSINEDCIPALYITPSKFLSNQVIDQANELGISCTDDPESPEYFSGEAICVTHIHRLVNGVSIFGGPGSPRYEPVSIGALVIDDAHACVSAVEEQTTVEIPYNHQIYNDILELFKPDIKEQSANQLGDLEDQTRGVVFRIPIKAWADNRSRVSEIIKPFKEDAQIKFTWPFVKEILPSCQAIFSDKSLEIEPLCPPTNNVTSLEQAQRRLYLTATLADDSILVTHFGVSAESAKNPITPSSAADIGDRLILSPLELNPTINETLIHEAVRSLADRHNVVVLVPSERRSKKWEPYTDHIVYERDIAQMVASLKLDHVGLVVFVNKYDGIDLPDDACRVLAIDGLPEVISNSERREAELLGGSDILNYRKLQRIEQGMGRGVRSTDDYCVILLLGPSLSTVLAKPHMRKRLGPATRAQLELSMSIAKQIQGQDINAFMDVIEQCLNRDEDWLTVSRGCLAGVTYELGSIEPFSVDVRNAFVASTIEQFNEACQFMSDAVNLATDDKSKGWLQEQLATYKHMVNPVDSQQVLAGAVKLNPRVMKPLKGVTYTRAPSGIHQANAAREAISTRYNSHTDIIIGFRSLVERLSFSSGSYLEFENALEELGTLLGFVSQRPERDTGSGPDVLWSLGDSRYFVIECKSEAESDVWKKDAAQLAHSMNWFAENYDDTCQPIPLLVHHSGRLAANANPPRRTRIIDNKCLYSLHESLNNFASSLSDIATISDGSFAKLLQHHDLTASNLINKYTISPPRKRS